MSKYFDNYQNLRSFITHRNEKIIGEYPKDEKAYAKKLLDVGYIELYTEDKKNSITMYLFIYGKPKVFSVKKSKNIDLSVIISKINASMNKIKGLGNVVFIYDTIGNISFVKKYFNQVKIKYRELMDMKKLIINLPNHIFYSKLTLVSQAEIDDFHKINETNLIDTIASIAMNDPAVMWSPAKIGDIVKIKYISEITHLEYRRVVPIFVANMGKSIPVPF